jgi:DNA-binding CsgD family transcriptional regulator
LERDEELRILLGRLQALRNAPGRAAPGASPPGGCCVLLQGEAGMGKSALLRRLRQLAGDGVPWLWGQGEPTLAAAPLAALIELLDALPPALAAQVRAGRLNGEVLAGMLALLRERARPMVWVVDDAHWADSATVELLSYVARRIDSTRALLVLAYRDDELGPDHPLRRAMAHLTGPAVLRLRLAPLSADAVAAWATRCGRQPRGLYRATRGNPFFVSELLACPPGVLPQAVRDAVLARVAALPEDARDVLQLVSLAPTGLEVSVLEALLEDGGGAIDAGVAAGLLERDGPLLRFRHELARSSVEQACGPQRSAALHHALFDALSLRGAGAARLVHHADRAGLGAAVLRLAPEAARQASAASAHRQAAELLELALRESQAMAPLGQARLREAHAQACGLCHRLDEAMRSRRLALALYRELGDSVGQGRQLCEMARLQWYQGQVPAGDALGTQAIGLLETTGDAHELAQAYSVMAQLHLMDETPSQSLRWATLALQRFEQLDDPAGLAHALNSLSFATLLGGDDAAGWALMARSMTLAREHSLDADVARAYGNLASLCLVHRRLDDLQHWGEEGLVHCQACDQDMYFAALCIRMAYGALQRGRFGEAQDLLGRLKVLPQLTPLEAEQSAYVEAQIGLRQGLAQADRYWTEMLEGRRRLSLDPWYSPQAVVLTEAAWLRGDLAGAARRALAALPFAVRSGERWRVGQLAVWLRRLGCLPADFQATVSPPAALSLAGQPGAAARAWAERGCRYDQALALLDGGPDEMREALALLDELGAAPAARMARRRLREAGLADVRRGPNRHARCDPLGLTARERAVLELLREGLSNRDMAQRLSRSERTVENHVATLLAKLNVRSRSEAVARAYPAAPPPP